MKAYKRYLAWIVLVLLLSSQIASAIPQQDDLMSADNLEEDLSPETSEEEKESVEEGQQTQESEKEEKESEQLEHTLPKVHFGVGGYRSASGKQITKVSLEDKAPWAFYHVWDKTLDPITGSTHYMAYFVAEEGDYAFCMNPALKGPEGFLPELFFPESSFRKKCEAIATVGLSSGGLEGYSFEENYAFSQMYIWSSIPLENGSLRYEISFRNPGNWLEISDTQQRYELWKAEVDSKIESLGKLSFDGKTLTLEVGKEEVLTDAHGQLERMSLRENIEGLDIKKEGNQLRLKATKAFPKRTLSFSYAASEYVLPSMSYLLQGHDETYQDLGGFTDPFRAAIEVEAIESKGRVRIKKTDEKGNPIQGAIFQLARDGEFKEILEELATDEQGEALSKEYSPLEGKLLYLREVSVPKPYLLDSSIKEVELLKGEIKEIALVNKTKDVLLTKKDEVSGKGLEGAVIELFDSQGEKKEYTTDEKGEILLDQLAPGDYRFREIRAPKGYLLAQKEYSFSLGNDGGIQGTTTWTNQLRTVSILKKDADDGSPLKNVLFEVFRLEGGEEVALSFVFDEKQHYLLDDSGESRISTGEDGRILLAGLPLGDYRLKEVKAAPGYSLTIDGKPLEWNFTVTQESAEEEALALTLENMKTGVVLRKVDELTGEALAGVEFEVSYPSDEKETFVTDEKGEIHLSGLEEGSYTYRETKGLEGYVKEERDYGFTVDDKGNASGEFEISNLPREVKIVKRDADTKEGLKGVGFNLYRLQAEEEIPISFVYDDQKGHYVLTREGDITLTSGDSGELVLAGLPLGDYRLREIKAAPGYSLTIDGKPLEWNFTVTQESTEEEALVLTLENKKTGVVLRKVDGRTGESLASAEFELSYPSGEKENFVTDEKGEIHLSGLVEGTYTYRETKGLEGYVKEERDYSFTVDDKGNATGEFEISNLLREVKLVKRDADTKEGLKGVGFNLYRLRDGEEESVSFSPNPTGRGYLVGKEGEPLFTSDEEGELLLLGLPLGDYLLKEVKAAPGYSLTLDGKPLEWNFTVTQENTEEESLVLTLENKKTGVVLRKVDGRTGESLAGVEFELNYPSGEKGTFVTDEKGEIHLSGLVEGSYSYRETKGLEGYVKDDRDYSFTVDDKGHAQGDVEVINRPTEVLLVKKDALSGEFLQGITLTLVDKEGKRRSALTDKEGKVHFFGLAPGSYSIYEPEVCRGFLPLKKNLQITLDERGRVEGDLEILNEPTGVLLRKTNEKGQVLKKVGFKIYPLKGEKKGDALTFSTSKKTGGFLPGEGSELLRSNEKGEISIDYLPLGDYVLEEVEVLKGYVRIKPLMFSVEEKHSTFDPLVLEVVNRKEPLPSTGEKEGVLLFMAMFVFGLGGFFLLNKRRA